MSTIDNHMAEEYDFSQAKRGPVVPPKPGTVKMMIWIDGDLLSWLRARLTAQGGGDYDEVIDRALREYKERVEKQ